MSIKKIFILIFILLIVLPTTIIAKGDIVNSLKETEFTTLETYGKERIDAQFLRGFAASKDGRYLYAGLVHEDNGLFRFNRTDGSYDGIYYSDEDAGMIKGIATDKRGYVYAGITRTNADEQVSFACLDKDLNELSYTTKQLGGKVGINGVDVQKKGNRYYLYIVTNYDVNTIRCYDVTDPEEPTLYEDFGENGIVNLATLLENEYSEANYIKVLDDGTVYITANNKMEHPKGDSVFKLSKDFSKVLKTVDINGAYGIDVYDDYVFVSTYNGNESELYVLNSDLKILTKTGKQSDSANYSGVAVVKGKIYISDQLYKGIDRILVSGPIPELGSGTNAKLIGVLVGILILAGVIFLAIFSYKRLKALKS